MKKKNSIDPKVIAKAIDSIAVLDLRHVSIEEIKEKLGPLFLGYRVVAPVFPAGTEIFRARPCDVTKYTHLSHILPPPAHISKAGRANREGSPIFYAASLRSVAFFETRPRVGQFVVLGKWITKKKLLLNHVGYSSSAFTRLKSNRPQAGWGSEAAPQLNDLVADYLADTFTQNVLEGSEHLYKISIAISERLIAGSNIDGLLYPTIAMRANADNLAIKEQFWREHLVFKRAEYAIIESVHDFSYTARIVDTASALSLDGGFLWKGRPDRWTVPENLGAKRAFENGERVVRDFAGRIIEPD